MSKHKVLHFVSGLGKDSGVMSVIMNYYRNIDRTSLQFDFMCFQTPENRHESEIINMGGTVFACPNPCKIISFVSYMHNFFKTHAGQYVAIHIHEVYMVNAISIIARIHGVKNIISHSHATRYSDKVLNGIRNALLCLGINRFAKYRFACSAAAGEFLYGKDKFTVINNAIALDKFAFNTDKRTVTRHELNIADDVIVIGNIGRFNDQKNHIFLLEILHEVLQINNHFKLLLIGDGPLFDDITKKIERLELENSVICLGRKSNIADYLCAMDIFILPSIFEGLPIVGIEAQAAGLPVVFSSTITREVSITNCEFIDLELGSKYWGKRISEISGEHVDRQNKYSFVSNNSEFDIKKEAKKLVEIYTKMQSSI